MIKWLNIRKILFELINKELKLTILIKLIQKLQTIAKKIKGMGRGGKSLISQFDLIS